MLGVIGLLRRDVLETHEDGVIEFTRDDSLVDSVGQTPA